jgi:hypothetical protein
MINQTIECQTGIKYDVPGLKSIGVHASPFTNRGSSITEVISPNATLIDKKVIAATKQVNPGSGKKLEDELESQRSSEHRGDHTIPSESEADRELHDILSPMHDELKSNPLWWLLELLPLQDTFQDEKGKWSKRFV